MSSFFRSGGGPPTQQRPPYQQLSGQPPPLQYAQPQPQRRPVSEKPRGEPQMFTVVKNAHTDIVRGNKCVTPFSLSPLPFLPPR